MSKTIPITEACQQLNLSPRRVRELCESGVLVRVNGITAESVAAYKRLEGKPERTSGRKPAATG